MHILRPLSGLNTAVRGPAVNGALSALMPSGPDRATGVTTPGYRRERLQRSRRGARTDHQRTLLQRQIDATDKEVGHLAYDLYGLTDDEVRIVEEATR